MGHVVRETDWCVIDLDTKSGFIFLQQRWQYTWAVDKGVSSWTLPEKREFHNRADRAIWATWSNRVRLRASGTSELAMRFAKTSILINLDVRWVTSKPHWQVTVTKIPPGDFRTSSVQWNARKISLDSEDFKEVERCTTAAKPVCQTQIPVAHEFGHAVGNTAVLKRGDEYKTGHSHKADRDSIMNVGSVLRTRHFRTVLEELNKMVPNTTFAIHSIA